MPFAFSDNTCVHCQAGIHTSCLHGGFFGNSEVGGAQAEAIRIPQADGTLVALPGGADKALMASLLTLTDVMATGHHAAVTARVAPGKAVAVVGDGAVGLGATELVAQTRGFVSSEAAPPALVGDHRCGRCSHAGVCLPEERAQAPIRGQIRVSDPLGETLHLTVPGSRASLSHGRIEVVRSDETLASLPIERVNSVVVQGNVDLSSGLLRDLMWRGIPTVWTTYRLSLIHI